MLLSAAAGCIPGSQVFLFMAEVEAINCGLDFAHQPLVDGVEFNASIAERAGNRLPTSITLSNTK